jgi:hypothetical protein
MTLLVRDEEDIVDSHLRFHLENGVDFVIATDHRSMDGTTDVLRHYERDGRLHLIRETSTEFRQAAWVTAMARLAATDFAADWVLNSDVDEFWWPREGTLREVLEAVPARFGVVHGLWRHFVMRPETGDPFYERMIVRTSPSRDHESPYAGALKSAHRSDPGVVVGRGNHKATGPLLVPLREWFPIEVLHFPMRTRAQLERKYRRDVHGIPPDVDPARHSAALVEAFDTHGVDATASDLIVDDAALARGLATGVLAEDTRVRDALRGAVRPPGAMAIDEDIAVASEAAHLLPSDATARVAWRLGNLERRVVVMERILGARKNPSER